MRRERYRNGPPLPPRPAIANTAEFVLGFLYDAQPCQNILHVRNDTPLGAWDAAGLNATAAAIKGWWSSTGKNYSAGTNSLQSIKGTDLGTAGGGTQVLYTTGLPEAAAGGNQALPNNVTLAISLRTTQTGRSHRGRLYHVGMTVPVLDPTDSSRVAAAHLAEYMTSYNALKTAIEGSRTGMTLHWVIVSWKLVDSFAIDHIQIDPVIDSQRRRLPNHNRHR